MNKTLETLREMLYMGMIDQAEYEEERNHYFNLVTAVHEFNERIIEKKIQLASMKKAEKLVNDPRMERLFALVADGIISVEDFNKRYVHIKGTMKK